MRRIAGAAFVSLAGIVQVAPRGTTIATYEPAGAVETSGFLHREPGEPEVARRDRIATG